MRTVKSFSSISAGILIGSLCLSVFSPALAQNAADGGFLITNARIFTGTGDSLIEGRDVLVENGIITGFGEGIRAPRGARVIDAENRVMTPGFIDMHYHLSLRTVTVADMDGAYAPDLDYIGIKAAQAAEEALMRGFTSLRDVGGASWGAKLAARENLKRGASQLKMHLAGGVGTEFDPIDGRQFTSDEIRAAVEVAEGFGTYVTAHVYTSDGIRQAIEAGVRSIEHGNLITEEIAEMMVENDVWLSPQVLVYRTFSPDLGPVRLEKGRMVEAGLDQMFTLAREHGIKIVFGTDVVVNAEACAAQNDEFAARLDWFSPAEILQQATTNSGELLQLSGDRSPYPGVVGRIEEGAHADLLLIDGNPLEDISILEDSETVLALIMKAGVIYKEAL